MIDKRYLKKILDFSEVNSIEEVVGKMEITIDFFYWETSLNHLIPFLKTYQFVTKEVIQRSVKKEDSFKNKLEVELLDIHFAELYYSALSEFLLNGKLLTPWKTYFEYCMSGRNTPFVQVLLGINSHINGDLATALLATEYKSTHDFFLVNDILKDVIPDLMQYLALEEKDYFGMAGILMKDLFEREFELIIVKWRENAWKNFKKLKDVQNISGMQVLLNEKTEATALSIINLFDQIYSFHNPMHVLDSLNKLEVKI